MVIRVDSDTTIETQFDTHYGYGEPTQWITVKFSGAMIQVELKKDALSDLVADLQDSLERMES
jgi:hypothetical protein